MPSFEVYRRLTAAGYTVAEAHHILRHLREESELPRTRKSGGLLKAQGAVRALGISPERIDFEDAGGAWR